MAFRPKNRKTHTQLVYSCCVTSLSASRASLAFRLASWGRNRQLHTGPQAKKKSMGSVFRWLAD